MASKSSSSSQKFVQIKEIRDGVLVLTDGSMRAILLASSINLSLKSADEQQAILYQFQSFLNSIEFSVQIVIQSRRLDIRPYLLTLEERLKEQFEPLLKIQTREYVDFIRQFTEQVNIMSKSFYIVVPYSSAPIAGQEGVFEKFFKGGGTASAQHTFEEKRSQLDQRLSVVESGLSRIGVRTVALGTEEIIELFYRTYNPGDTQKSVNLKGIGQ